MKNKITLMKADFQGYKIDCIAIGDVAKMLKEIEDTFGIDDEDDFFISQNDWEELKNKFLNIK